MLAKNPVTTNKTQLNAGIGKLNLQKNSESAKSVADILLAKSIINQDQYKTFKFESINTGKDIEQVMLDSNVVSSKDIYEAKSEINNIPFVDLRNINIDIDVLNKITQNTARKNGVVVFEETAEFLKIATSDPLDLQKIRFIKTLTGRKIEPFYADPEEIRKVIETRYGAQIGSEVTEALEDVREVVEITGTIASQEQIQGDIASAPVARIVNMILEYAARYKASDVHIEPRESRVVVRYRISGVLQEKLTLPRKLIAPVVSRIKILSNLKIDEHRVPQDGRFQIKVDTSLIDLRVSIMPSVYGEKVVIRLLAKGGGDMTLEKTGLRGRAYKEFIEAIKKSQGVILVTGPTGSGKTQTLASAIKIINRPDINIMTLEDPVEIRIDGVTQVQINNEVGLSFAKGLRSFLRQDPDVILVGEIRDTETAELAIQASLTGHLVLATLHTNNASSAIPRLKDMGVEPFLLASTLELTAGQRLVRKICDNCKTSYAPSQEELSKLEEVLEPIAGFSFKALLEKNGGTLPLYKGRGCARCEDTGYKGRIGIFEVMKMSEKLSGMVVTAYSAQDIEKKSVDEGMITMIQDGFLKAVEGMTTISEVLRVVS